MNAESQVNSGQTINFHKLISVESSLAALLTSCAFFVGGPVLSLLILASLLIARVVAGYFGTALGICLGLIFSLLITLIEFLILVPILRSLAFSRSLLFDETWIEPFVARTTTLDHLVELNRLGAILVAVVPVAIAFKVFYKYGLVNQPKVINPVVAMLSFVPLLVGAFKKLQDPMTYVAPTASGDGRNFFLDVQRIRATSGFTNLNNFISQGDLGASLSSLVSDGFGSRGLFQFNDQYSVAALYIYFGILISASAIAIVVALIDVDIEAMWITGIEWVYAVFFLVSFASIQMPWVMNEMFRSGFFSTVAAMSLCAVMVAICLSQVPHILKAALLLSVAILAFAVYQVAAIYPLVALTLISLPTMWKRARAKPFVTTSMFVGVCISAALIVPRVVDQLRSRLLLEGAITPLKDSLWIPLSIAGVALLLTRGRSRSIGFIIFIVSTTTAGFQIVARALREADGQFGYGYYGVKIGYIGLFILLLTLISGASALLLNASNRGLNSMKVSKRTRVFRVLSAAGLVLLASAVSNFILPESRGFFGKSDNWTQPTAHGLELALDQWNRPRVVFARVSDPGNDKLINFWHPYFWSGDPWNWAYSGNNEEVDALCLFIKNKDALVVTGDSNYAKLLEEACQATVQILK